MSHAEFQLCEGLDYEVSVFMKLELYFLKISSIIRLGFTVFFTIMKAKDHYFPDIEGKVCDKGFYFSLHCINY